MWHLPERDRGKGPDWEEKTQRTQSKAMWCGRKDPGCTIGSQLRGPTCSESRRCRRVRWTLGHETGTAIQVQVRAGTRGSGRVSLKCAVEDGSQCA